MPNLGSTEKHYNLAIKEIRKLQDGGKILLLEVGAGSKIIEKFLPKNIRYETLDFAEEFWKEKYTFNVNIDKYKFPIQNKKYDIIICHETLEHVMYPDKVVQEIIRVAKKNAIFFFSMPNEYNFLMRIYYLFGKKTKVDEPFKVVEKNLHIHKPRVKDILNFFSKDFKIEKVDYTWQSRKSESSGFSRNIDSVIQMLARLYPSMFARTVSLKASLINK